MLKVTSHDFCRIEEQLSMALEHNEFYLLYQPQVRYTDYCILGTEALLRWRNPVIGELLPSVFIPLIEQTGQIIEIGDWVLRTACDAACVWERLGCPLRVSINVSTAQLQPSAPMARGEFVSRVEEILEQSGLAPRLLALEITESMLMHDNAEMKKNLKKLKKLGVSIACDDFGMGYSSFHRLKQFPFDTLKIDQSLIHDLPKSRVDLAIVGSIIDMSRKLDLITVAEGVESQYQYEALHKLGCDLMQGYYYSPPLTDVAMAALLVSSRNQ